LNIAHSTPINALYSLHPSRDETGMAWAKRGIVKVRVAENCLSLILVRHHPSFLATTMKTVTPNPKPEENPVGNDPWSAEYFKRWAE